VVIINFVIFGKGRLNYVCSESQSLYPIHLEKAEGTSYSLEKYRRNMRVQPTHSEKTEGTSYSLRKGREYNLLTRNCGGYILVIWKRQRVLYILAFTFLDSKRDDRRFLTECCNQSLRFQMLCLTLQLLIRNFSTSSSTRQCRQDLPCLSNASPLETQLLT
jgi:hypothetical protein